MKTLKIIIIWILVLPLAIIIQLVYDIYKYFEGIFIEVADIIESEK